MKPAEDPFTYSHRPSSSRLTYELFELAHTTRQSRLNDANGIDSTQTQGTDAMNALRPRTS